MQVSRVSKYGTTILLFLASQNISLFGSLLVQYAITWYITLTTQSGVMMTLAIICGFLPTFIISPFAGVWADRYNRKTLIILSDSVIAVATFILAILFFLGHNDLWLLFVVLSIRSVGAGIHTPSVGAILPQLVPQEKLTKINATNTSIQSMAMLIAPMISGMLLVVASIETIFFIDVITAAIAVSVIASLCPCSYSRKSVTKADNRILRRPKTWHKIHKHSRLSQSAFRFCSCILLFGCPSRISFPPPSYKNLWQWCVAFNCGWSCFFGWYDFGWYTHSILGWIQKQSPLNNSLNPAYGRLYFRSWNHTLLLALLILYGVNWNTLPLFNVPTTTLLQQKIDPDFLGRVFGVLGMISSVMMPMGMIFLDPWLILWQLNGC